MQNGEHMIEINGIKHWVKVAGAQHNTVPLVAIHGGPGGHHWMFERTGGPLLEQFATVIYYEQRGCGRSEAPEDATAYSYEHLIADLEALRQALELDKIIPLGHSFGGELALEYAVAHPDHVAKVILEASASGDWERLAISQLFSFMALTEGETRAQIRNALNEGAPYIGRNSQAWGLVDKEIHERFTFYKASSARLLEELWTEQTPGGNENMRQAILHNRDSKLLERIRRFAVPVLVMTGLHDRNTGLEMSRDIAVNLPNAQLEIFAESGHYIHMDEPEKMAAVIQQFLTA